MTDMDIKTVINEIVTELHGRENYLITRVSDNMVQEGFPQLYITCLDKETCRPINGIWCRVGDVETDFGENGYYKCMEKDSMLKREGYDVCYAHCAKEAVLKIDFSIYISSGAFIDDDITYSEAHAKSADEVYEETERINKESEGMWS